MVLRGLIDYRDCVIVTAIQSSDQLSMASPAVASKLLSLVESLSKEHTPGLCQRGSQCAVTSTCVWADRSWSEGRPSYSATIDACSIHTPHSFMFHRLTRVLVSEGTQHNNNNNNNNHNNKNKIIKN